MLQGDGQLLYLEATFIWKSIAQVPAVTVCTVNTASCSHRDKNDFFTLEPVFKSLHIQAPLGTDLMLQTCKNWPF